MAENPYESTKTSPEGMKPRSPLVALGKVAALVAIVGLAIALLLPARRGGREAARRNQCLSQIKQIALAFHNYTDEHGSLPPAYTVDEEGHRLHSWRTLLLPYMEEKALYDTIDLAKPWDDPANDKARQTVLDFYLCPSSPHEDELHTTYVVVVGPEFAFTGSTPRKLSEVSDGTSKTIAVVEANWNRAVHWMSPEDIDEEGLMELGDEVHVGHPGVFQAAFLDGRAKAIQLESPAELRRAMLTVAGGEEIEE